ncbi:hypothetical protein ALC53_00413 [Atta colombica]|uniref:Uncharacterized protein n=1 Tax=Atta colombica TaxID=520822 RepID=A0A195BX55_9HYME|nr:hypothetical protein ALC53_00413 [Atta colombica]
MSSASSTCEFKGGRNQMIRSHEIPQLDPVVKLRCLFQCHRNGSDLQGGLLQRDSRNTDSCGLAERRETVSKSSDAAHQQTSF